MPQNFRRPLLLERVEDGSVPDVDPELDDHLQNYDEGEPDREQSRVASRVAPPETERAMPESAKKIFSLRLFRAAGICVFGHTIRGGDGWVAGLK